MRTAARAVATGLATTGVLAAGSVAVAVALGTGAGSASAAGRSSAPDVAELQDRLAQLQADTDGLTQEITATTAEIEKAQAAEKAEAAREAAAAASAGARQQVSQQRTVVRTKVVVRTVTKKQAPPTHTTTKASGSGKSGDDGDDGHEGGSDD